MKVVFHFGPPKCGTSAIQKWMSSNRQWLINQHVYYPDHVLDVNGVSSGNLRKIFKQVDNGFEFSDAMMASEIEKARKANCSTIVFSSEFFFRKLDVIAEKVPDALFVGYVRFGLEMMQSSYNQSVKRHGKTEPFNQVGHLQSTLRALSTSIAKIGEERFELRPYSRPLFEAENIVTDFLSVLGLEYWKIDTSVGRINPSYCLESIEVKRWFNQLPSGSLQTKLDLALQSYGDGEPFSLFSDSNFEKNKAAYLVQLQNFLSQHKVNHADKFYQLCESQVNKPYKKQELSTSEFKHVLTVLLKQGKFSLSSLYFAHEEAELVKENLFHAERVETLKELTPGWFTFLHKLKKVLKGKS